LTTKAYAYIATSLDGFIARKNGDLDWLPSPNESEGDYGYQEFVDSMDILIMGRNTFEKVLSFGDWPYTKIRVMVLSSKPISIPENLSELVETSSLHR